MKRNIYADFTFKIPFEERLRLIKENGFDGVMLGFSDGLQYTQYEIVHNFGLEIENVHSPFDRMNALWDICPLSTYILDRTLECVRVCGENGIKTMICHPTDGLVPPKVTKFGLENFFKIIDSGEKHGVDIAFENIQLPEFLDVIFGKLGDSKRVKFCYDVGHENCFSKGTNCLEKFGGRLACLHIHDNDGKTDGHLIPFDGNVDYSLFLKRLKGLKAQPPLSMEVYMSKSPIYKNAAPDSFVKRCADAADKLEKLYGYVEQS